MNLDDVKNCLLFECISGSRAYGLATESSDVDIRGVFVLPRDQFYSFDYPDQISDERNNIIYFEVKKFLLLLSRNNPNMLELLNIPEECVLYKHPLYDKIQSKMFLSKLCKDSFARYAMSQLDKAWGLNKKIINPMDQKRKTILDFCTVLDGDQSISLHEYLKRNHLKQEELGLKSIASMSQLYAVYKGPYKGVMQGEQSMDVMLSSIPKGEKMIALLSFNLNGYSSYLKKYHEYWDWVANRNEVRFGSTLEHGKNYDAKNMMHVFRLLNMAEGIAKRGVVEVKQDSIDFLLKVKSGAFSYEELVDMAHQKIPAIEEAFLQSDLPETPPVSEIERLLIEIRKEFYMEKA